MALINLGINAPEETLHQLKSTSIKSLQQMKAATGLQPKASRIPPLVPTFKARVKLQLMTELLPHFQLYQKCKNDIKLDAPNDPVLPKGANSSQFNLQRHWVMRGVMISLCRRQAYSAKICMRMTIIVNTWFKRGAALGVRWNLSAKLLKLGILHSWMHVCLWDWRCYVRSFVWCRCLSVVATVFKGPSSGWAGWLRWSQMSKLWKLTCMKMSGMFLQTKKYYCGKRCCKRSTMKIWV